MQALRTERKETSQREERASGSSKLSFSGSDGPRAQRCHQKSRGREHLFGRYFETGQGWRALEGAALTEMFASPGVGEKAASIPERKLGK